MEEEKKQKKKRPIALYIVFGFIYLLSIILIILVRWSTTEYSFTLTEIIYTLTSPLKGTDTTLTNDIIYKCVPAVLLLLIPYIILVLVDCFLYDKLILELKSKKTDETKKIHIGPGLRKAMIILFILLFGYSLYYAGREYHIVDYIKYKMQSTKIYEEEYVTPTDSVLTHDDEDYKNLIFIYMESMETTYASKEAGGAQEVNLIPNLTKLAEDNISFSNTDKLGGFHSLEGTTWTMGALFGSTTGVPFSFPVEQNSMGSYENFAKGITTLGDILEQHEYNQEFLCGSDGAFAGRSSYYKQHGSYKIFDYNVAVKTGYINEGYWVNWGFEDEYLYEIAKDELTRLANKDEPFNLTMLTVDTHFPEGYVCDLCPTDDSLSITEKAIICGDKQLVDFLDWCKEQDFYEDTVIIVIGDHPRMDTELVGDIDFYDRTMYNCFINCDIDKETLNCQNREYTILDIFPTTLSALGFDIDGDRLGLGTDMFSNTPTLAEDMGYDKLEQELQKNSNYYLREFK